jgi:hypothetical protein
MLLGYRHDIGDMVAMAVREQDVLELGGQDKSLGILGILSYERIDEDICARGSLDENGGVAKPGYAGSLVCSHGSSC